jgi:transposase
MLTAKITYRTERIDHLGIVSGICQEIGLVETIDDQIGANGRQVSVGQAAQAMVLNGLGFASRALYLTPEFYSNKPVDMLIGEGITAEMLNDDSLGDALDRMYAAGVTELFAQVAARACDQYGIETRFYHLDSSSFHLHGEYEQPEEGAITITHGYSRDHRPDLKQVVASLITTHQAAIPTWLEALSGNSSDKSSFPQTVAAYQKQLAQGKKSYFVADSALYTKENIGQLSTVWWVTRVPLTLKAAQTMLAESGPVVDEAEPEGWEELAPGYQGREYESAYGGVKQRWLVVFSRAAYDRESKTFARQLAKAEARAQAALAKLEKQTFACQPDAEQAVAKVAAKWRYHRPVIQVEPVLGYGQRGRPAKGSKPTIQGYRITGDVVPKEAQLAELEQQRGKFILATNQLEAAELPATEMLAVYKAQGVTVERGFRFLKDPLFFADSLFLKKPSRLMALLMIMGLSLLIYALAERQLRLALQENNQTIPDQVGKPTQRPTMRRVFQMFEGIDLLIILVAGQIATRQVLNLRPVHRQIVTLLGPAVKNIYIPPD